MMKCLEIIVRIKPPFLTNQQGALRFGLDAQTQYYNKRPVIPGSLIKGNLREILEVVGHKDTETWLGKKQSADMTERAQLIFSYFWEFDDEEGTKLIRPRIRTDEETGVAAGQMLRFAEVLDTADGSELSFKGQVYCPYHQDEKSFEKLQQTLERALSSLGALGSEKGIGFGKLKDVSIRPIDLKPSTIKLSEADKERILSDKRLEIGIDPYWPICFPHITPDNENSIVSKDIIPGSAIKAILAQQIGRSELDQITAGFDQMRITHARYTHKTSVSRPKALPLSLARIKIDGKTVHYNMASSPIARLVNSQVPVFQPDWKDDDYPRDTPQPPRRHLLVRNKHSHQYRAAENEKLFSMESLQNHLDYEWRAFINLPENPEQANKMLEKIESALAYGLYPLGKTRAIANITLRPAREQIYQTDHLKQGQILFITLQSDVQLFATDSANKIAYIGGRDMLDGLYESAWKKLSDNSLEYQHGFTRQKLKGGEAWYQRYIYNNWDKTEPAAVYQPQIFISEGSVFALKVTNPDQARRCLNQWQSYGLSTPEGVLKRWDDNPWIPENGLGEIIVEDEASLKWKEPRND